MRILRFDLGDLGKPERLDNGFLRVPARITRVGVFEYRNDDGSVRRELRPPEEVFDAKALSSFEAMPFTNEHPAVALDEKNTSRFQKGSVLGVRQDGDSHVAATIQITDAATIEDAEKGKREVSCGYQCDVEMRAGITNGITGVPDGLKFDAIQRNIRGNHVALVDRGRAGESVALRFDHGAIVTEEEKANMETIRIDGVDYEVTAQVAQVFRAKFDKQDQEIVELRASTTAAESKATTESARADAAEEKATELEGKLEGANDPAKIKEAVDARVSLEREAAPILGDDVKLDDLSDSEIKIAVVKKVSPKVDESKLEGDYLTARYDGAIEASAVEGDPKDKDDPDYNPGLSDVIGAGRRHDKGNDAPKSVEARNAYVKRGRDAWKETRGIKTAA